MAVKIKLKRIGKVRVPQYRIVVADSRTARGGRAIEELGIYQPKKDPSLIRVDSERVQYWLGVGALPTQPVLAILKVTGDWQRFKGLPGAEGTLRVAEAKTDKMEVFNAAAQEAGAEKDRVSEARSKAAKKAAAARTAPAKDRGDDADAASSRPEAPAAEKTGEAAETTEPEGS